MVWAMMMTTAGLHSASLIYAVSKVVPVCVGVGVAWVAMTGMCMPWEITSCMKMLNSSVKSTKCCRMRVLMGVICFVMTP